jgi:hypothetical protein
MVDLERLPLSARVANAIVAYATYLEKTVWPNDLAIIYPVDRQIPPGHVALSVVILFVISLFAWRSRSSRPYCSSAGCGFWGMLVPVIGLVQVGRQAAADRYTYLPLIGLFVALVLGAG